MSTDFDKMAEPTPKALEREIMLEGFKANAWRVMLEHQAEVSELFGKIDALMNVPPARPLITLLVAHLLLDGLRRRNRKMTAYALLEEAMAEVAQHFGDTADFLCPPT